MKTIKSGPHPALYETSVKPKGAHPSLLTRSAVLPSAGGKAELPISMATVEMREVPGNRLLAQDRGSYQQLSIMVRGTTSPKANVLGEIGINPL